MHHGMSRSRNTPSRTSLLGSTLKTEEAILLFYWNYAAFAFTELHLASRGFNGRSCRCLLTSDLCVHHMWLLSCSVCYYGIHQGCDWSRISSAAFTAASSASKIMHVDPGQQTHHQQPSCPSGRLLLRWWSWNVPWDFNGHLFGG